MRSFNPLSNFQILALCTFTLLLAGGLVRGNPSQNWLGGSGTGGDGTWDVGTTPDWNSPTTWVNADQATFLNSPGTITVDGSHGAVSSAQLYFGSGAGNWIFNGSDITFVPGNGDYDVYTASNNVSNVTINNNIDLTYNSADNGQVFQNNGSGILTFNGNIIETNATTGGAAQQFYFDAASVGANGAGTIVINSTVAATNITAEADFGFNGGSTTASYILGPNANFSGISSGINIANGTILLQTANAGATINMEYGAPSVLTDQAGNYSGNLYERVTATHATFGGGSADASSFSGSLHVDDDASLTVTAAAGGRVTLNNNINGTLGNGLIKTGTGTVVIAGSSGGLLDSGEGYAIAGTQAADLQAGTTLITNTSDSAFGNGAGTVNLEAGATLGGNGSTFGSQMVVAKGPTAVVAPGDAGQANLGIAPSIGTLSLYGGLEAASGLTMDFKLTGQGLNPGSSNDFLIVGSFTLGGTVTVNLTALDALETGTGNDYVLLDDDAADSIDPADFNIIAPTGYQLDSTYDGDGVGGGYDYSGGVLTVQLVATPEPSTYGAVALGLVMLGGITRLRRRTA